MNLVSLARFNERCFSHDPVPMPKLWRWCREKRVPARKIGGEWFVDLDEFNRALGPQTCRLTTAVLDKLRPK